MKKSTRQQGVTLTYTRQKEVTLTYTGRPRVTLTFARRPRVTLPFWPRATLACASRPRVTLLYARRPRVTLFYTRRPRVTLSLDGRWATSGSLLRHLCNRSSDLRSLPTGLRLPFRAIRVAIHRAAGSIGEVPAKGNPGLSFRRPRLRTVFFTQRHCW